MHGFSLGDCDMATLVKDFLRELREFSRMNSILNGAFILMVMNGFLRWLVKIKNDASKNL